MATAPDVWYALKGQFEDALDGLVLPDRIVVDTPAATLLSDLARDDDPLVHIFDLKNARNTTRWPKLRLTPQLVPATLVSTLSGASLPAGGQQTITLSGTPGLGDGLSLVLFEGLLTRSAIVVAANGATLTSMATALAAKINNTITVKDWITATSSGAVVTITSKTSRGFRLITKTGNGGVQITEVGRTMRAIGVTLWTGTETKREAIAPVILVHIMKMQNEFGMRQLDGTWTRIKHNADMPGRDDKNNDIYRWDFILDCELGITTRDAMFAILGANITKIIGTEVTI